MHIDFYSKNELLIGCNDRTVLEIIQERTDGHKIRGKNQIHCHIKAGPKLYRFKDYGLEFAPGVEEAIRKASDNITKRKEIVKVIKSQYGHDIQFDYDNRGKYEAMDHQKIMFNMAAYCDSSAILADPGTCKTGPYLWAIDKRIQRGEIKRALVITLSTLKKNVLEEMSVQTPHLRGIVLDSGARADKIINKKFKIAKKNQDYDVYIASYEAMYSVADHIPEDYFQMVILDEAHRIAYPGSRQTKCIIKTFDFIPYKTIATGTLHGNNCMSFFMPFRFLGPDTIPTASYYDFRKQNMFAVDEDKRIWVEVKGTKRFVGQITSNISVYFSKDDCLDLPGVIYQERTCKMDSKQKKYYTELKTNLITEIDDMCKLCNRFDECKGNGVCDQEQVIKSALVAVNKLQQIACGFYINTSIELNSEGKEVNKRNVLFLPKNPKLELLMETLNTIPYEKKVIIWSNFTPAIETIVDRLKKAGMGECLTAYQSDDAFAQVEKFKTDKYRFLVANPTKAGVGLNIQFSSYQIFYSNSYSYIKRDQAISRQDRKGQTEKVTVYDMMCEDTVDVKVLKVLKDKRDLSQSLSGLSKVIR